MDRNTVDIFNPKVIRSTMGSIYRVPFAVVDTIVQTIPYVQSKGIKVYAAHLKGSVPYDVPDYRGGAGFLIGNEGNGLSSDAACACDARIRIPMDGAVESLNAAVSASIIMYEARRQKGIADNENMV
jgi:TrmH family RNA methyltransferase